MDQDASGPVDISALLHRTREARAVWNHTLEEAAQLADGTDLGLSSRIRSLKHAEPDDGRYVLRDHGQKDTDQ